MFDRVRLFVGGFGLVRPPDFVGDDLPDFVRGLQRELILPRPIGNARFAQRNKPL